MKKTIILLSSIIISISMYAQEIAIQSFGNNEDPAIIFLHGGPGYNSVVFEKTTANRLAQNGYFVLSYDRRGEGRNESFKAEYSFEETINDLDSIYMKFNISSASLIGHSFGGIVATYFTQHNPEKVNSIFLVGAPISMQETFKNILSKSKEIYKENSDNINLNYIDMLEKMDSTSLQYSSYTFMHAMQNGFYSTNYPNSRAIELYSLFKSDELLTKYASKMEYVAAQKFWENEKYTTISIKNELKELKLVKKEIYGIYGQEDGLYSKEQIKELMEIIEDDNVLYFENCSHNVYIDQQEKFIQAIKIWK